MNGALWMSFKRHQDLCVLRLCFVSSCLLVDPPLHVYTNAKAFVRVRVPPHCRFQEMYGKRAGNVLRRIRERPWARYIWNAFYTDGYTTYTYKAALKRGEANGGLAGNGVREEPVFFSLSFFFSRLPRRLALSLLLFSFHSQHTCSSPTSLSLSSSPSSSS